MGAEVTRALNVPSDIVVRKLGHPLMGGSQRGGPEYLVRAEGTCTTPEPLLPMDDERVVSGIVGIVDTTRRCALLLRRFDTDRDYPSHWCFPGGRVQTGETPIDAAAREVLEETGLTIHGLERLDRRESTSATGRIYLIDCFLTTSWSGSLIEFPSAEHAGAAWMPFDALIGLEPAGPVTRWVASTIWSRFTKAI